MMVNDSYSFLNNDLMNMVDNSKGRLMRLMDTDEG